MRRQICWARFPPCCSRLARRWVAPLSPSLMSGATAGPEFLEAYLSAILLPLELPAIAAACGHALRGELRELVVQDQRLEAALRLTPFAGPSRQIGRMQLARMRPLRDDRTVRRYLAAVESGQAHGWHTIVYGLTLAVYSLPLRQGLLHYAQETLAGLAGAAGGGAGGAPSEWSRAVESLMERVPAAVEASLAGNGAPGVGRIKFIWHLLSPRLYPRAHGDSTPQLSERGRLGNYSSLPWRHHRLGELVRQGPAQHARLFSGRQGHSLVGHWTVDCRGGNQRPDHHRRAGHGLRQEREPGLHSIDHRLRHCPRHPGGGDGALLFQGGNLLALPALLRRLRRKRSQYRGRAFSSQRRAFGGRARVCRLHSHLPHVGQERAGRLRGRGRGAGRHCLVRRALAALHLRGRRQGGHLDRCGSIRAFPAGGRLCFVVYPAPLRGRRA